MNSDEWGWCSSKCQAKNLKPGSLLETELTILEPKLCEKFFNQTEVDEGFDSESELCAGSIILNQK